MSLPTVLGIDWHKRGWVGVLLSGSDSPSVLVDRDLAAMIAACPHAECVAVDMPIGLPASVRDADAQARSFVQGRRNSVFMTPPLEVLSAPSYEEANKLAPALTGGKKITPASLGASSQHQGRRSRGRTG